jgi:hypothetical protein
MKNNINHHFDIKLEKIVVKNDFFFFVMNENLANKYMGDMVIYDMSFENIMKNYLRFHLHTKVNVLKIITDGRFNLK